MNGSTGIEWYWSDKAPSMFNHQLKNEFRESPSGWFEIEIVNIETTVRVGDIYLFLGEPNNTNSEAVGMREDVAFVRALYAKNRFLISSLVHCPVSKERFLNARVTITFMTPKLIDELRGFSSIYRFC